jgi:hypothetical protein
LICFWCWKHQHWMASLVQSVRLTCNWTVGNRPLGAPWTLLSKRPGRVASNGSSPLTNIWMTLVVSGCTSYICSWLSGTTRWSRCTVVTAEWSASNQRSLWAHQLTGSTMRVCSEWFCDLHVPYTHVVGWIHVRGTLKNKCLTKRNDRRKVYMYMYIQIKRGNKRPAILIDGKKKITLGEHPSHNCLQHRLVSLDLKSPQRFPRVRWKLMGPDAGPQMPDQPIGLQVLQAGCVVLYSYKNKPHTLACGLCCRDAIASHARSSNATSRFQLYACFGHGTWLDSSWTRCWSEYLKQVICTLERLCWSTCMLNQLINTDLQCKKGGIVRITINFWKQQGTYPCQRTVLGWGEAASACKPCYRLQTLAILLRS